MDGASRFQRSRHRVPSSGSPARMAQGPNDSGSPAAPFHVEEKIAAPPNDGRARCVRSNRERSTPESVAGGGVGGDGAPLCRTPWEEEDRSGGGRPLSR